MHAENEAALDSGAGTLPHIYGGARAQPSKTGGTGTQLEKREYEKQQEKFRRIQQSVEYKQATITRQNPSGGRLLKRKCMR